MLLYCAIPAPTHDYPRTSIQCSPLHFPYQRPVPVQLRRLLGIHRIPVQNSTVQYSTLHYTTLHYNTVQYTTIHYSTLYYTILYYTILHYTTLHYTTLYYTTLLPPPNNDCLTKNFTWDILWHSTETSCYSCRAE